MQLLQLVKHYIRGFLRRGIDIVNVWIGNSMGGEAQAALQARKRNSR
jgi:hypothetical protein